MIVVGLAILLLCTQVILPDYVWTPANNERGWIKTQITYGVDEPCYESKWLGCWSMGQIEFRKDIDFDLTELKVDGGASTNNLFMQIQSNASKIKIIRPVITETTAYGAALAAAIGNDQLQLDGIDKFWKEDKSFSTNADEVGFYQKKSIQWDKFIRAAFL